LGNTNISGTIPSEIGSLAKLVSLNLQGTLISGTLPESLGKLTEMQDLYYFITTRMLQNTRLTGFIPESMNSMKYLGNQNNPNAPAGLDLANTDLSGAIPLNWTKLPSLSNCNIGVKLCVPSGSDKPQGCLGSVEICKGLYSDTSAGLPVAIIAISAGLSFALIVTALAIYFL
jgi:hypothetical protein